MSKVLIVDDKQENRTVLMNLFKAFGIRSGIELQEADSGEKAFEMIKKEKPDLVFMDVRMETNEAGLDTIRKIRQEDDIKDTPIWVITAQAMEAQENEKSDRDKAISAGCNDYIPKPFDTVELVKKISDFLKVNITPKMKRRLGID